MRTIIYVDWFNFYHRIIKTSGYRWLDISQLFNKKLKTNHKIIKIKFFTSNLLAIKGDNTERVKQRNYHNAIQSYIPNLEMYFGKFKKRTIHIPRNIKGYSRKNREFTTFEEKGTDVNLAIEMLSDALLKNCECVVLVSNDSDFSGVLRKIKTQSEIKVGLLTPGKQTNVSNELIDFINFHRRITLKDLKSNRLPERIPDTNIIKPPSW